MSDLVNAAFEWAMALCSLANSLGVLRARGYKGISPFVFGLAFLWGVWNLYYYPSLGQWSSFSAGLAVVASNLLLVALMVYFGEIQK